MNEDRIRELLQQADRAAGPGPGVADGLAGRVRLAAGRRRVVRAVCAAAGVIVFIGGAALVATLAGDRQGVAQGAAEEGISDQEIARLRAEIEELRADVDMRITLIDEMIADRKQRQRLAAMERELARPDPLEEMQLAVEKTACIMVYRADILYNKHGLPESAIRDYRRTIELFPETHWAEVARKRLSQIETSKTNEGNLL